MSEPTESLRKTPLHALHVELNGRLVDFAGWSLPVRFDPGPVAEHLHTRASASLFDVSHMGVVEIRAASLGSAAKALETVVPADVVGLTPGKQRYTMLTNEQGGVIDDLIVAAVGDVLVLVVNGARREVDLDHLRSSLGAADSGVEVVERADLALLAVQGPAAVAAVESLVPGVSALGFMEIAPFDAGGTQCRISRSGYTGEDGVELQVPADAAVDVARALLAAPGVEPAGLAARDSLRLEAGLCLYGNDLDEQTTPIEAGLAWSIPGRRRSEGGFPGADVIRSQLRDLPPRMRVGLRAEGRQPVRAGTDLVEPGGSVVGRVTSGGYGPTFGGPVAMGYVTTGIGVPDSRLIALERGRELPVVVTTLPFITRRYHRTTSAELFQERP
jgi:aminomethyltransferase